MAVEIRDPATGQIKTWVWIAFAAVVVGVLFLTSKVSSGSSSDSGGSPYFGGGAGGGQSSDITDYLTQLNDAIIDLQGSANIPTTTATLPSPNPTNPQYLQDIINQLTEGNQVLEQVQQNLLSLFTSLSGQQEAYTAAVQEKSVIKANIVRTKSRIADIEQNYKSGRLSKKEYKNRIQNQRENLNTYQSQLSAVNKTIATIEAAINAIQAQIAALGG